ncbi:DASH family cryptochrome [Undibacterium cyanobacteriorum]|uniref:Cryptochrome DASH n=1 Tax=Undibacterium cyanobacteriorum TaxID=3073561 RepID=A0ABY9RKE7_9BURK|nr:DASH family cryptochrome [Undibacterium sp. 20NA77.5]WMW81319.1 DASH family cryptochrome [Undibacterium sp. 20NA77.5]
MTIAFLFRNDFRLHDQTALQAAITDANQSGQDLLCVVCRPDFAETTRWGWLRWSPLRQAWWCRAVQGLAQALQQRGQRLLICAAPAPVSLARLAPQFKIDRLYCEEICAPEEMDDVQCLEQLGFTVKTVWQSSLLDPHTLPWEAEDLPAIFTDFRKRIEQQGIRPPSPLAVIDRFPGSPDCSHLPQDEVLSVADLNDHAMGISADRIEQSSFPFDPHAEVEAAWSASEYAATQHLQHYLERRLPHTYKKTRNQLSGTEYSSKWSPWLANGTLSARLAFQKLQEFEAQHGANDGSYWLWFELLWRDYFRCLHLQYRARISHLYRERGLLGDAEPPQSSKIGSAERGSLQAWCQGTTGVALVDAAMRELAATGYLSNRLRQVVASYLIYELNGDWRAGAAWFESQLLDYDVYSNQGNWLYIAGHGTDPRGGRRFNIEKQEREYDADGTYRQMWLAK